MTGVQTCALPICNLAFVAVVPLETRYEVARTWLALRLPNPLSPEETPIDIAAAAVQAFAWSDIPADLLRVHLQATIVCHIANGGSSEPIHIEWARLTCVQLVTNPALRPFIAEGAAALGVEITPETEAPPEPPKVPESLANALRILSLPPELTDVELEERRQNILFDLPAYAEEKDAALDPRTISQAKSLCDQTLPGTFKTALYFAANDIWRGSWMRGDRKLLSMATDLALYRSEERRVGKECRSRWSPYH